VTRKERAQVVELLRCAHDVAGIGRAAEWLGYDLLVDGAWSEPVWQRAVYAWESTSDLIFAAKGTLSGVTYEDVCLEAAQRVEDKEWPRE
jgi:hypothetical protein